MIKDLVQVKRSKKAKRVALRLDPVERVINLVVPQRMSLEKAYFFAMEHEQWVRSTLENLPPPIPFTDGTILPVFGDTLTLDIRLDETLKRTTTKLHGDILKVRTYQTDPTNRITTYLKKIAHAGLSDLASDKAEQISKTIKNVSVRDTKSRWGSCSQDGNISFSWRLMFAPYHAIDYVVAHEVAHMIHMDHSKSFWNVCEALSCDYKEGKRWMKMHGNELMRYGAPL